MHDPLVGKIIANRYSIIEKVGAGGMAIVYRGQDQLLGRPVAIKVLRQELGADTEFVSRFRQEAKNAASLAHPNVVTTYDVGEDDGIHFIVMEFVGGQNLKEHIRQRGRLQPKEVVSIAIQIAQALCAAHGVGLIHRDIKPHNILITPEGTVKVTDFGIARAQSAASMTQTGMAIGSVHYFSPQQARGEGIDGASDLYSLGVVLYEMSTGKLPFSGDSSVAVALKHLNDSPTSPRDICPDVPPKLESLIMRLLSKDPVKRGGSAAGVLEELQLIDAELPWEEVPPPVPSLRDETKRLPVIDEAQEATMIQPAVGAEREGENEMARRKKRRGLGRRLLLFMIVFLSMGLLAFWAVQILPATFIPEEVQVPDITGLDVEIAQMRLDERGLRLHPTIRDVYSREVPAGLVMRQEPAAQRWVRKGREIHVTVSRGPEYVVVPDVVGMTRVEAQLNIAQQNLILGNITEQFAPDVPPNTVIGQDPPAGTRLEEANAIDIVVALGSHSEQKVTVPDVRGMPVEEAQRRLSALGLIEGQLHGEPHPSAPINQVIDQNPPPGEEVEVGYPYGLAYAVRPPVTSWLGQGSQPTEVEEKYWESRVLIAVPDGPAQEVVILITDDWGPRQVLREIRRGGSRFYHPITIRGDRARIQVWMDGIPHMNEEVFRTDGG